MKLCAMLKDARNCVVTFTDWPMDRVDSSPSSGIYPIPAGVNTVKDQEACACCRLWQQQRPKQPNFFKLPSTIALLSSSTGHLSQCWQSSPAARTFPHFQQVSMLQILQSGMTWCHDAPVGMSQASGP